MTRARLPCSLHFPDQSLRTKVSIIQHIFFSRSHEFANRLYFVLLGFTTTAAAAAGSQLRHPSTHDITLLGRGGGGGGCGGDGDVQMDPWKYAGYSTT